MAAVSYPFVVSAPGKVIVFGEHAVVHGRAALAAAVSLRSYLFVDRDPASSAITLDCRDIGLRHAWATADLPWAAVKRAALDANGLPLPVTELDAASVQALKPLVAAAADRCPDEKRRKMHASAALAFLYVYMALGAPELPACTYLMRSTLPLGAGLGSSASISVCIGAALLLQAQRIHTPAAYREPGRGAAILHTVNEWAFTGELCIHGTPSGVDNTVATHGRAVLFKRLGPGQPPRVTPLPRFPQLPLLIVDSQQSRSTAVEVQKVADLLARQPAITTLLLDACDKYTEAAHALMTADGFDATSPAALAALGELVRGNHGVLVSLGVSHPRLERIRQLVDDRALGWTKLTGAGGGGCAFTLLAKPDDDPAMPDLRRALADENYLHYRTLLGARGLALMQDLPAGVTLETLSAAATADAVDALVGAANEQVASRWDYYD